MGAVLAVAALAMATGPAVAWSAPATPSSALVVRTSTPDALVASFGRSTSLVTMDARSTGEGRVTATVTVGGRDFSMTRDAVAGTASWTGRGAVLTPGDKAAFAGALRATHERVAAPSTTAREPVPASADLTLRLLMLLAEAPAGVAIGTSTVPAPKVDVEGPAELTALAPRAALTSCIAEAKAVTGAASTAQAAALAACQVSHDQGILYMSCSTMNRTLRHDAAGHCFLSEQIRSGPASSECMGECGPGCNGINAYTYDCGDHDRCGRVHGGSLLPWDAECGDEYWDADDDTIWGEINRCR